MHTVCHELDLRCSAFACVLLIAASAPAFAAHDLRAEDLVWLNRLTYGINTTLVAEYRREGRAQFLRHQLESPARFPPDIARQIASLDVSKLDGAALLRENVEGRQRIKDLPAGEARETARKAVNDRGNALAAEAARRELLRAIYSSAQLQERLTWFWLNHFSVLKDKGYGRWLVADYTERAIRPHVLGRFPDLVMATLSHPAMLHYLDNSQNGKGHINENYARELLELHTLGVGSGYTQQDVQELARILTGVGINTTGEPLQLTAKWQPLYLRDGAFEFNPTRHDFGDKLLLGRKIEGSGFDEVRQAVALIVSKPECARFISRRLATYFVADEPPPALVERMSRVFMKSQGDIRAVVETMVDSKEFVRAAPGRFRDPMQYVVATVRLAYDGKPIQNIKPVSNWLNGLGEPLYGRASPDGYPLVTSAWTSSGQMSRRFEIARAIGSGNAGLFQPESGGEPQYAGFPQLATRLYYDVIEPQLAASTRAVLNKAESQAEWNTYLLSSPELNSR
jgi:uncharacterized protein (DUF1800 family)